MSWSRAALEVGACGSASRALRATATAPQRWSIAASGGWLEATHQLLGDGVFGGDRSSRT